MFNLIKYEFRKNITAILVLFGIVTGLEIVFLINAFSKNEIPTFLFAFLLMFTAIISFFYIFMIGVMTYSKELSSKSSYLIFMTPNSTTSIVLSKLFFTCIIGVVFVAYMAILFVINRNVLDSVFAFREAREMFNLFNEILRIYGMNASQALFTMFAAIIQLAIYALTTIVFAYLSITATATVLQSKKFKWIITVVVFILIMYIYQLVGRMLPLMYERPTNAMEAVLTNLPLTIYSLVLMIASLVGTIQLLDKKVSL